MTDKEAKKIYDSKRWKIKRIDILKRDRFECQDCRERLRKATEDGVTLNARDRAIRRAVCVHHIKELKENPELAFEDDNLISLCDICHNARHGRYTTGWKRKRKKPLASEEKW